jgi:hypothetical protein
LSAAAGGADSRMKNGGKTGRCALASPDVRCNIGAAGLLE